MRDAARSLPWTSPEVTIIAQGRPIREVLTDFGEQQGLKIVVDPAVQGVFSGEFRGLSPAYFLDQVSKGYNLTWFFAGGILYVSSADQIELSTTTLRFARPAEALAVVNQAVINSLDGTVRSMSGSNVLLVSGPPKYVELVNNLIATVDQEQEFRRVGETIVEVFPLKNAWAYDITLDSGAGVPTQVRGVASTLSALLSGGRGTGTGVGGGNFAVGAVPQSVPGALSQSVQNLQERSRTQPGPAVGQQVINPGDLSGVQAAAAAAGSDIGAVDVSRANIIADVRTNSVIIRDTRENMEFFESVIRQLDVPVRVIEITVAILDVRLGYSRLLGLNSIAIQASDGGIGAAATSGDVDATVDAATDQVDNLDVSISASTTASTSSSNANVSGLNVNSSGDVQPNIVASAVFGTTAVTAAITALQQDNKATILSRPTILTLDNYGAVINQQETFYVNSVGEFVSDLFNVSTGLSLQVVPHILRADGPEKVALQVRIEDGTVGAEAGGTGLPSVRQATLTTQAVMLEGQSLLIGGLFIKGDQNESSGIPFLSNIPLIGYAFSVKGKAKNTVERLFLITPKVVEVSSKHLGDYSEYFRPSPTVQQAIDLTYSQDPPQPEVHTGNPTEISPNIQFQPPRN